MSFEIKCNMKLKYDEILSSKCWLFNLTHILCLKKTCQLWWQALVSICTGSFCNPVWLHGNLEKLNYEIFVSNFMKYRW